MSLYEDVAATLTPEIRKSIEDSIPCIGMLEHLWDWRSSKVENMAGEIVRHDVWSVCVFCGKVSS